MSLALLVAACALLVGCLYTDYAPTGQDRAAIVTIDTFAEWVAPHDLTPLAETLTKRRMLSEYELSYEYDGESESLKAIVRSEVYVSANARDARNSYRALGLGFRIGALGDLELEEVDTTLDWAEESKSYLLKTPEGQVVGNAFLGYRDRATIMTTIAGAYSSDPALFDRTIDWLLRVDLGCPCTPGDFNADGAIDAADFAVLASNFGTGTVFGEGDLNFDGQVNLHDFVEFRELFAAANPPAQAASVPEPSGLLLLGLAGVGWLPIRRRRARRN